jgi:hypothetical protein
MLSAQAFAALLWAKPEWQRYFADDVAEVRRSFVPLALEIILLIGLSLLLSEDGRSMSVQGLVLQAAADLAATACFLVLLAVGAMRLGYRDGLCRVIAALNWVSLLLSILAQLVVGIATLLDSQQMLLGGAAMLFIWMNVVIFRLLKQGLGAPVPMVVGAMVLHILLVLTFTQTALEIQMRLDPPTRSSQTP